MLKAMRPHALLLALPILLAGCGGGPGVACAAVYAIEPVAAFAGHYTATFTPKGASAATRTLDLTVAADGSVTGTVLAGDVAESLDRFSRAGNVVNECDRSQMALSLNIALSATENETLDAGRDRRATLLGDYPATLGGTETVAGTLTVTAG